MKRKFQELRNIDIMIAILYEKHPYLKDTKFAHTYRSFIESNFVPTFKNYNKELLDVNIDNAAVDPKTKTLLLSDDKKSYKYTKEGAKQLAKDQNAIIEKYDVQEIEIVPYICKDIPVEITLELREHLKGLMI